MPVWADAAETTVDLISQSTYQKCSGPDEKTHPKAAANPEEAFINDHLQTLDAMHSLYQPYLKNISGYKPLYFLVGSDPGKSKFQISFKYRVLHSDKPEVQKPRWQESFYIAYTQSSFWDLGSRSQPFKDTSYKPEFFFLSPNAYFKKSLSGRLFFQSGFAHESNGRGEDFSRSTNFFYFQPIFIYFHQNSRLGFLISPKIWTYLGNDNETNPDLPEYRGYFDLEFKAGQAERLTVGTHFRLAAKGASFSADLTYPLDKLLKNNLNVYVHIQYVNALAESLLNYKDRSRAVRFGFAIVR
jgi:phospholipase A1